jgi:glycosyltransferase involved in cell wall biosynthesis
MRILVVTSMYPPHHYGGYELSCRDCVNRWRAAGHDVTVLTSTITVAGVGVGQENAVRRELLLYWDDHVLLSPSKADRLRRERGNQRSLQRALADVQPDVVSVWQMGAMSLGLLTTLERTGIPVVLNVCDDWLLYAQRLDAWTRMFASRPLLGRLTSAVTRVPTRFPDLGRVGHVCFVSEATRERAATSWQVESSTVVYSGIDRTDFPDVADPVRPPWSWRLLYVGRLDERKGIHVAVDALAALPAQATLTILGTGDRDYQQQLLLRIEALGVSDRVQLRSVERKALAAEYAAADVLVFPSTWTEPFGLTPLEAMACGTPVVTTGTGGSGEFCIDGLNCLRVEPGSAEELATAVRRLAQEPALRAELVAGGLRTARLLTVDALADCLASWHVAAAERFARGRPADRPAPRVSLSEP